ncbi:MAG: hypothetical protein ACRDS0_37830 [Pseudonocardiaceae bacterium]
MNEGSHLRLKYAGLLLTGSEFAGLWPRCTAWLIRLALEHALDHLWATSHPGVAECPMRSQLLVLRVVVDIDTQYQISELWGALSRAGHHHHYELSPTAAELRGWLVEAQTLVTRLDEAAR